MPREVLYGYQHSGLVSAPDVGRHQIADLFGIFAKGPRVDDGIGGIGIHVGVGKEIPVNADGSSLCSGNAAEIFRVLFAAYCAKSHGMREDGRPHQAHGDSALEVRGKQQGKLGVVLQPIRQLSRFVGFAAQKKRAIHMNRHGE